MGLTRQEYWSGFPCPPPENLSDPRIKLTSPVAPALQADSLDPEATAPGAGEPGGEWKLGRTGLLAALMNLMWLSLAAQKNL